jgi:cell division protein FtsQ
MTGKDPQDMFARGKSAMSPPSGINAETEIYPPEALADEEPRYLRRQKPLEIRRRKFGRKNWPAYRRWLVASFSLLAGGCLVYGGTRFFLFSPRVTLASDDQIEVTGNRYVGTAVVTDKFAADLGRSVLRVPLEERRAELEAIPWIAQATVQRALPNRLRVELTERTPVAFLRADNQLSLVDENGAILDRPLEGDFHFPVATGFDETMPQADREKRMHLYVEFMRDIDLSHPGSSDQVSEVNLADDQDLRAALAGLPGLEDQAPVQVHFGDSDFGNKYRLLLDNIGQWRASAGRVESVDLRFARQVVVNPERDAALREPRSEIHSEPRVEARNLKSTKKKE